jgi:predicted ribosomally synthesized peptide with SipW-like signal peptide
MLTKNMKRYLMLLAAIGLVAVASGGGSGTFASFSADVANQGNYIQTGTLFLHDTANGVTCSSESATNNSNIGTGDTCSTIFNATLASGTTTTYYAVKFKNAGTLNASGIKVYAPGGCSTVSASSVTAATVNGAQSGTQTTIAINPATYGIPVGTTITIGSQSFTTATTAVRPGDTSITISSATFSPALTNGQNVTYFPSFGAGDLCTNLDIGIVETDNTQLIGGAAGCAFGTPSGSVCTLNNSTTFNSISTNSLSPSALTLVANGGTGNSFGTGDGLDAGGQRYFLIAVKPDATFGNSFQNKKATIDLVWHIDQV